MYINNVLAFLLSQSLTISQGTHTSIDCDIRERRVRMGMTEMKQVWEMAIQDPHLMRLGEYLAHVDSQMSSFDLEADFLRDPWIAGLTLIHVVDPDYRVKPFILLWNNKGESHSTCPFYKRCAGDQEKKAMKHDHAPYIPGVSEKGEEVVLPHFKKWEEREKGGRMEDVFHWAVKKEKLEQKQSVQSDGEIGKTKKGKTSCSIPDSNANHCQQSINKIIKNLLMSKSQKKNPKKSQKKNIQASSSKTCSWRGPREAPSQVPQTRASRIRTTSVSPSQPQASQSYYI